MNNNVYESVLYDCYQRLVNLEGIHKHGKTKSSEDKKRVEYLNEIIPQYINELMERRDELSEKRIDGYLLSSKQFIILYARILNRNSQLINRKLRIHIERLIRLLCRMEAERIESLRSDNPIIGLIDIDKLFNRKKTCASLAVSLASSVIEERILHGSCAIELIDTYYVTNTGRKYHKLNCPVCKNRTVRKFEFVKDYTRRLQPCKCIAGENFANRRIVTAFVDESRRLVDWDINGDKGIISCFSYIVCEGYLSSENQISETNLIIKGVDWLVDDSKITHITEQAISKVLTLLAYDLGYNGCVVVYTDNESVARYWMLNVKNRKLEILFHNVSVVWIPREMNTKADKLLSSRMHLNIPMATYNKLKNSNKRIEKLEARVKELEEERAKITGFVDLSTTEYKS